MAEYKDNPFYIECCKIEMEMKNLDPERDKARLRFLRHKIAELILKRKYDEAVSNFGYDNNHENTGRTVLEDDGYLYEKQYSNMVQKSNVYLGMTGLELDDLIAYVALEVCRKYDPLKGPLFPYINNMFKYRAIDKLRAKTDEIDRVEYYEGYEKTDESRGSDNSSKGIDEVLYGKLKTSTVSDPTEHSVIIREMLKDLLQGLAMSVKFIMTGNKTARQKRLYSAYFSHDVLWAVTAGCNDFRNVRELLSVMSILFMNHCTVAEDAYCEARPLSIENMNTGRLKTYREVSWIPQDEPKPVLDGTEDEISFGDSDKGMKDMVFRGYLAQVYDDKVTPATISNTRREYGDLKNRLRNDYNTDS